MSLRQVINQQRSKKERVEVIQATSRLSLHLENKNSIYLVETNIIYLMSNLNFSCYSLPI